MKASSIFAASLLVAGAAFAGTTEVTNDLVIGVMPLSVGKETILNIPWVEAGSSGDTIAVSNIVKTANLVKGDTLLWYNGSQYKAWAIDTTAGVNYWQALPSVTTAGVTTVAADAQVLSRGQALILNRLSSEATTIYIVGQHKATTATEAAISNGYNLLAPPGVGSSTDLMTLSWSGAVLGDRIVTYDGTEYIRGKNGTEDTWGSYTYSKGRWSFEKASEISIPAGNGFWYDRVSDSSFNLAW